MDFVILDISTSLTKGIYFVTPYFAYHSSIKLKHNTIKNEWVKEISKTYFGI